MPAQEAQRHQMTSERAGHNAKFQMWPHTYNIPNPVNGATSNCVGTGNFNAKLTGCFYYYELRELVWPVKICLRRSRAKDARSATENITQSVKQGDRHLGKSECDDVDSRQLLKKKGVGEVLSDYVTAAVSRSKKKNTNELGSGFTFL